MEKKIKRLEIAVVCLSILFVVSIFFTMYAITQIKLIADKIPNYTEIKQDVKYLKDAYDSTTKDSVSIKEKITKTYDSALNKSGEVINFLKKQRHEQ